MRHIFIINPYANNSNNKDIGDRIFNVYKELGINFEIAMTLSPNEAENLAKYYSRDQDNNIIFAVGGDGTINRILNGIVGSNSSLGVIPLGSGNDFYKTLNQKPNYEQDCSVMKVNERYCLNIFSLGYDAEVCKNANLMKKVGVPASSIYNLSSIYSLFKHKPNNMLIDIDGKYYYDIVNLIAVCNGQFYGNGFRIAPNADLSTDKSEICIATNVKKYEMPGLFYKVSKGTHYQDSHFLNLAGENINISSDNILIGNIDGEIVEGTTFNIKTNSKRINVVNDEPLIRKLKR